MGVMFVGSFSLFSLLSESVAAAEVAVNADASNLSILKSDGKRRLCA